MNHAQNFDYSFSIFFLFIRPRAGAATQKNRNRNLLAIATHFQIATAIASQLKRRNSGNRKRNSQLRPHP
jgi:hypothetical protein